MTSVKLSGLASGLDTDSIITQLLSVESAGRKAITLKQAAATQRQTDLTAVKTGLTSVALAATGMRSVTTWTPTQDVSSSDTAIATATRTGGAAPGGVELTVTQLASAEQRTFAYTSQAGASSLSIGGTSVALDAGATASDAAAAINGANAGVYAVEVAGRLVIGSRTTGAASTFAATGDALTEDPGAARAGRDAQFSLDGGATQSSASNVLTGTVAGVQLTLRAKGTTSVVTSDPSPSADVVVGKVKAFLDAYNSSISKMRSETTEKRVVGAASTSDAAKGALYGDTGLNDLLSRMRSSIDLSDLGVSTGAAATTTSEDSLAGKLTLDEDKLRAALAAPGGFDAVRARLTTTSTRLSGVLDAQTQAGGVLDQRLTSVSAEVASQASALTRFDARLATRQGQLEQQFAALEAAMARSQRLQTSLFGTTSS